MDDLFDAKSINKNLALLGDTKLLILDEPFVGLNPVGIRTIREFIKNQQGA